MSPRPPSELDSVSPELISLRFWVGEVNLLNFSRKLIFRPLGDIAEDEFSVEAVVVVSMASSALSKGSESSKKKFLVKTAHPETLKFYMKVFCQNKYSQVPIKRVGQNKRVGRIFYVNFIKNRAK